MNRTDRFSFRDTEVEHLFRHCGRRDAAAYGFVADCETCINAYAFARRGGTRAGLPASVAADLDCVVDLATKLRSALYRLPEDIAALIDLHLLSEGAVRRIGSDIDAIALPLEDLAMGIAAIQAQHGQATQIGPADLNDRLISALATAYRNRFNLKPRALSDDAFPALLDQLLEFAAERVPELAQVRSDAAAGALARVLQAPERFQQ